MHSLYKYFSLYIFKLYISEFSCDYTQAWKARVRMVWRMVFKTGKVEYNREIQSSTEYKELSLASAQFQGDFLLSASVVNKIF